MRRPRPGGKARARARASGGWSRPMLIAASDVIGQAIGLADPDVPDGPAGDEVPPWLRSTR